MDFAEIYLPMMDERNRPSGRPHFRGDAFQALSNKAAGIVSCGGSSDRLRAVELIKSLLGAFPIHIGLGAVVLPFIQFLVHNGILHPVILRRGWPFRCWPREWCGHLPWGWGRL